MDALTNEQAREHLTGILAQQEAYVLGASVNVRSLEMQHEKGLATAQELDEGRQALERLVIACAATKEKLDDLQEELTHGNR